MKWGSLLMKFHDYNLQPTTRLKTSRNILFWKCPKRKGCSKISKILKNHFQNCPFFSNVTGLQSRISNFSKNKLQEKFPCECSKIVGNLPGKEIFHSIKVT